MTRSILLLLALAWATPPATQGTIDGDRVVAEVRAALVPALPFPDTDDSGSVPANNSPEPLWMVRPLQPGERTIEVMANPLNAINQARATKAMAQIGASINSAQRRAELQYEQAIAEAKRTGRSQDVDGVSLSDEGIAGARIDAEAHVSIDVDFNQPSYLFAIASSVPPASSRAIVIGEAVAVIASPSNTFRRKLGDRTEETFSPAETIVFFGTAGAPEIRERSEHAFEVAATGGVTGTAAIRSMAIRMRGNEALIADILKKADWNRALELLK